jgi:predicted amidohydrolase YtcJ
VTAIMAVWIHGPQPRAAAAEAPSPDEAGPAGSRYVVIGRIWTGNPARPWADAAYIDGERFAAVGSRAAVTQEAGPGARVLEFPGGLIVPGLIDAHIHLIEGGLHLTSVQLRDAASREEFVNRVAEFARRMPASAWMTGGDWDHTLWGGELPDRNWIDAATPETPVWMPRLDGHMALANTAAMRAAGIDDDVADVPGGEIVRDAAGRPTGIFKDNAMQLIDRVCPLPGLAQRLEATAAAMDYLAARGVTAVHHMGTWQDVEVFRLAQKRGLLKVRVYACTPLAQWQRLADELAHHGRGDAWLSIGGLKGYVDGSLGSHTAAFLQPFTDTPDNRGLLVNTADDLESWTTAADAVGLQVMVHAIGDRAIRLQLDVFERVARRNGARDRRFRIEHAQHIAPEDVPRFGSLGVVASMQPYHAIDDGRWAERVIGARRSETSYAFRSLLDSGAHLAFGSDWYVAPATPLEGVYAAVTRRTLDGQHPEGWVPAQRISVAEALRAYTSEAAYAAFQESSLGTIEPGKLADLVAIEDDLFEMPPEKLGAARVKMTIVGGRITFDRSASEAAPPTP